MRTLIVTFLLLVTFDSYAQDVDGSKDYYLFNRMPDFNISKYDEIDFGALKIYDGANRSTVEGKKYSIDYTHKNWADNNVKFPSRLQILRNYSNAIVKAGGDILFERYNSEHGYYSFIGNNQTEVWMQVKITSSRNSYKVIIVERAAMQQDIVVNAELIKNSIEIDGKIAIYGIYFDVAKSLIKQSSEPAFEQIAKYLKENPAINCWIVGHTDADGSFKTNSTLSLERAQAVKAHLQEKYAIKAERLFAEGVGPLAPVASNTTAEGKKRNRRVELVKK